MARLQAGMKWNIFCNVSPISLHSEQGCLQQLSCTCFILYIEGEVEQIGFIYKFWIKRRPPCRDATLGNTHISNSFHIKMYNHYKYCKEGKTLKCVFMKAQLCAHIFAVKKPKNSQRLVQQINESQQNYIIKYFSDIIRQSRGRIIPAFIFTFSNNQCTHIQRNGIDSILFQIEIS